MGNGARNKAWVLSSDASTNEKRSFSPSFPFFSIFGVSSHIHHTDYLLLVSNSATVSTQLARQRMFHPIKQVLAFEIYHVLIEDALTTLPTRNFNVTKLYTVLYCLTTDHLCTMCNQRFLNLAFPSWRFSVLDDIQNND